MSATRAINQAFFISVAACLISGTAFAHSGSGIAVDKSGCVYFLDTGSGLWKIDAAGRIAKIADPKYHWTALDEKNACARTRHPKVADSYMVAVGTNPTVFLFCDYPIAIGADGNLYYAQMSGASDDEDDTGGSGLRRGGHSGGQ